MHTRGAQRDRDNFHKESAKYGGDMHHDQQRLPSSIDIRFDKRNDIDLIRDEALNKYEENAYLLGKIFSISQNQNDSSEESEVSEDEDDDLMLGQQLNHYQTRHSIINTQGNASNSKEDAEFFRYQEQAEGDDQGNAGNDEDAEMQTANEAAAIDAKLLSKDPEGQALLEQQRVLSKEKRAFVDQQRKTHEHLMRDHKEFLGLVNKIKTNQFGGGSSQPTGTAKIEDMLKECHNVLTGQGNSHHLHNNYSQQTVQRVSMDSTHGSNNTQLAHPVFVELQRFIQGSSQGSLSQDQQQQLDNLRPWSVQNRDKLKVLQL